MVNKKTWQEFRNTGLFLLVNQFLHIFGWSLVCEIENGQLINVYPARVKFRGFDEESQSQAYAKVSKFMAENSHELLNEADDEQPPKE